MIDFDKDDYIIEDPDMAADTGCDKEEHPTIDKNEWVKYDIKSSQDNTDNVIDIENLYGIYGINEMTFYRQDYACNSTGESAAPGASD